METMNSQLNHGPFPYFGYLLFKLFPGFFHDLFNSCRVYTAISDQSLQA
jgi:hypothetical protein